MTTLATDKNHDGLRRPHEQPRSPAEWAHSQFVVIDSYNAPPTDVLTLNKYLYADGNPILGSDPSGYFDDTEYYQMSNMAGGTISAGMPARQDVTQPTSQPDYTRPIIEIRKNPTITGDFGGVDMLIQFSVIASAPDGWIIQHVIEDYNIFDQNGVRVKQNTDPHRELWEAWEVIKGRVLMGTTDNSQWNGKDEWDNPDALPLTYGNSNTFAVVKFISNEDLTANNVDPNSWPKVGALPTTNIMPKGWTDEGGTTRLFSDKWNDCIYPPEKTTITEAKLK